MTKKQDRVRTAIAKAEDRIRELEDDANERKRNEVLSGAIDVIGGLLGGKRNARSILGGVRRASTKRRTSANAANRVETARNRLAEKIDELDELQRALALDLDRFDLFVSRFGIMFFAEPAAAFAHMKKALAPSGRLAFVCWRPMKENGWVSVPFFAALPHLPPQEPPVPGAPGPFAFADPERFRGILKEAGYRDIEIDPFDATLSLGRGEDPVGAALEQTLEIGPLSRALKELPDDTKTRAAEAVREELARHVTGGEVRLGGAVWLVSARA